MLLFKVVPGGFSYLINQNNFNSNWKKSLRFRNMQEKLEKKVYCLRAKRNTLPFCHNSCLLFYRRTSTTILFFLFAHWQFHYWICLITTRIICSLQLFLWNLSCRKNFLGQKLGFSFVFIVQIQLVKWLKLGIFHPSIISW